MNTETKRDIAGEGEAMFSAMFSAAASEPARGVGGKLKRQSARRYPATPYSRPAQNQVQRKPWISRIVDPAYRIISDTTSRLLPYLFSKAASAPALTAPDDQDQHQDELQDDPQKNDLSINPSLNIRSNDLLIDIHDFLARYKTKLESASIEGGTSSKANLNESNFKISAHTRGKITLNDVVEISELERLMEGKTFSRAETDRLIEIINSRAIDLPDAKRDERNLEISLREEGKKNMSYLDKKNETVGGKDANSELWATPTPLAKSIIFEGDKQIRDEAGLSPAELAKAYMGGHTSSTSSQGFVARKENDILDGGMLVGKSLVASPSSKPCWPGIKLSEQCGFVTPRSQRESFGLQNLPRTPYSRTILPNSKSKLMQLQNDNSKRVGSLQSPSQSAQTRYGQLKLSKGRDGGLFGPNRRSRQSSTPSIMSPYSRPFSGTSPLENSAIIKSSEAGESSNLSTSQTTTYDTHKGSKVGTLTVAIHSSHIARTILDHLERTQPTPKNKSAELKLATSWRYPQSSKTIEQGNSNVNTGKKDVSVKSNEDTQNIFSQNPSSAVLKLPATTTGDTQNGMTKTASASNGILRGTHAASGSDTTLPYVSGNPKDSLSRSTHEELVTSSEDAVKDVPYPFDGKPANILKPPSQSLGNNKPALPSISVAKPFHRWAVPLGSNASFTFPVSSSDGASSSSEPTTPSIMPFTTSPAPSGGVAITRHHEATKDDEIPQFGFDSESGGDKSRLVFDFPSLSKEVMNEDDSKLGIKFTFGSEKPERISFSSAGSNGVCC